MLRRRTARLLVVLAAVCALGAVLPSAFAAGGLSISPAILEHRAAVGNVGSVVVSNTASTSLKITVTPRPWRQARSGAVSPDRSKTLRSVVGVSAKSFTLAPGTKRTVDVRLLRKPSGGALYAAMEVVGKPTKKAPGNGITAQYRIISSLRLTAARARHGVRIGDARVSGKSAVVAVRNTGNTVDPVAGSVRLVGPRGTVNRSIAAVRVLPGGIVDLKLAATSALPKGSYTATISLTQGGAKVASAKRTFRR
ncbi:MAG TPA: hypothetical protein VFG42_08440 [Baekduia sp.]|uniref:hypothetical protein n=1 Tax=Baekduia sp. TaxID=2600305 RepID=UPI002D798D99|nr:hypothetical protein [Baekduia sp.]HET6506804.1 hypothetical protein [Baekduia sp.]